MPSEFGEALLNWSPMLLIAAIWIFFVLQMQKGEGRFGGHVAEMRAQTRLLERIADALEKRNRLDR
jgi:hypothetical protein